MSLRISIGLFLLLAALTFAAEPAWAARAARPSLLLRGRACDVQGVPIVGAKVTAEARGTITAKTNSTGEYTLALPLPSLAELARKPYTARVRCEGRGWHFSLPGPGFQLGLELKVVAGADTILRCVARSNDARVAGAAAHAVSEPESPMTVVLTFIGEPGELVGRPPDPELDQVAQMALPGTPALAGRPKPARPAQHSSAPTSSSTPMAAATTRISAPAVAPDSSAGRAPASAPPSDGDGTATKPVSPPPAPSASIPETRPARSKAELQRLERQQRAEERLKERQRKLASASEEALRRQLEQQAEKGRKRAEHEAERTAEDVRSAAKSSRTSSTADTASLAQGEAQRADTAAVLPGAEASGRAVKITPAPGEVATRSRAAPLVIRGPGARMSRPARPEEVEPEACECRVRGTIEIDSQNPLGSRLRVAIALARFPALADTVELFMGSPRAFRLPPVPCGTQQLKVTVFSRGRFEVTSPDAMANFRCEGGPARQFRLKLTPR